MKKFDIGDSLGARSPDKIAEYLREIGDNDAGLYFGGNPGGQAGFFATKAYAHTGIVLGFISEEHPNQIVSVSQIRADRSLLNKQVKITLDKFYVHNYPGTGRHTIVCEFQGKNQVPGEDEDLTFAFDLKVNDRAAAGIAAAPIFVGLTVGQEGISFKGRTINVKADGDEIMLEALSSPIFKSGLSLLNTAQPALKPFTSLAIAVANTLAKRSKNVQVMCFDLGLDFNETASSASLRKGSYVVVQSDDPNWDWNEYSWNTTTMSLIKSNSQMPPEANYMVLGVT